MAKVVKKVKKAQRGSVSCPNPFKRDYDSPGFVGRLREKISDRIQEGRDRRAERRERDTPPSSFRGALGKPSDRPIAIDYIKEHREQRNPVLNEAQTTTAKKGKKVTKAKTGGKVKPNIKKPIIKLKNKTKKK